MPNAILSKHDGTIASVPVASVLAILSTALDPADDQKPMLRSIVMTDYRGLAADFLAHTGQDAAVEIEKARPSKKALLRRVTAPAWLCLDCGDDVTRLRPGSVPGYETVGDDRIRIYWRAQPDTRARPLIINDTPENRARLDADIAGA